ncbi:MAG: 2-amino-4-hydroxy-6-hydroxymethyldihydropteridine diphosphokinase [Pseudomonadota bacterium]
MAFGANLPSSRGNPLATCLWAVAEIGKLSKGKMRASRYFRTPAFPPGSGPDFINAVAEIKCDLSPEQMLATAHKVEADAGRHRKKRWESRPLDIDMLSCGDMITPDIATVKFWMDLSLADQKKMTPKELILPHPRMHERGFVLAPLMDIAPDWRHPISGLTVNGHIVAGSEDLLSGIVAVTDAEARAAQAAVTSA